MPYDKAKVLADQFADIRILRFNVDSFNELTLNQKKLIYYLSEAAVCGRDILFDQHFEYNLVIRKTLETIYQHLNRQLAGNAPFDALVVYLKRVWFSSGIHHHYSTLKLEPGFSEEQFRKWFGECDWQGVFVNDKVDKVLDLLCEVMFSDTKHARRVSQEANIDLLARSCNNFYKNVSQAEAEGFYARLKQTGSEKQPSFGLNSRLVKTNGKITEERWCENGKYAPAIEKIVGWLTMAISVAENTKQARTIELLISYYKTGDLAVFDQYNIEWLSDQTSQVDFINGFIEVYGDPLGLKGSWESLVNVMDKNETQKVKIISDNAQWFEDRSPIAPEYRKPQVAGVSMKIIQAVTLGGDCYPASPLGINLPNADWIREMHGSKSVSLSNISDAHHLSSLKSGVLEEFAQSDSEIELHRRYGKEADHLHTHLHECLGHGSGRLKQGVTTDMLKAYSSVIEEARADLFALYFMMDPQMISLGMTPTSDMAVTHYNSYIRNGLMVQLTRIKLGADLEQAHMRNRQLIAAWSFEKGTANNVIEKHVRQGKTYFRVNDHLALRQLFGQLLYEVQRIKSEGDYESAKHLVETYGVKIDRDLHQEVLERFEKLKIAPFAGFVNPTLQTIDDGQGNILDVTIDFDEGYSEQMLRYSTNYDFLVRETLEGFNQSL